MSITSVLTTLLWLHAVPLQAQAPIVTERVPVRNVKPSRMLQILKTSNATSTETAIIPFGTKNIVAYDQDRALLVRGTEKAVSELKEILRLLDVRPQEVQLEVRLVRHRVKADGTKETETVLSHAVRSNNNEKVELVSKSADADLTLELIPRVNGDGTLTLFGKGRMQGDDVRETMEFSRRIEGGREVRIAGLTSSLNGVLQSQVREGKDVQLTEEGVVYYLQVQTTIRPFVK